MLTILLPQPAAPPWQLHLGRRYAGPPRHESDATEKYYTAQSLDHFASNAQRLRHTWSQRYFEDVSSWSGPGAPVIIGLGGEAPAYGAPSGLAGQIAQTHGAALITLEHRFYGQSHPTANMTAANLAHLDAEQALADAAQFIWWWSEQHQAHNSSFISWGGSYAGQLAAWMRLRYPTSVAGAVAFSAPVLAQLDFYQYNRVVTDVVRAFGGAGCVQLLEDAFAELVSTLKSGAAGRTRAAQILKACNVTKTDDDDATLRGSVSGAIQSLVQYNEHGIDPSVASFCAAGASASSNGSTPLEALGAMLASLERYPGYCMLSLYDDYMEPLRDTNFTTGTPTTRQWYYQLCNAFGQQGCEPNGKDCGKGVPGLKPSLMAPLELGPLAEGLELCDDLYGLTATPPAAWSGHQRGWTNVRNGGRELEVSNVIFVNGRRDPYSSVSVLPEQLTPAQVALGVKAVAVTDGSHCVGMKPASSADSPDLAAAKAAVGRAVAEWV